MNATVSARLHSSTDERYPENESLSERADRMMADLDVVLRCECCAPSKSVFRAAVWPSPAGDVDETL
jgi:hypothetical protein